MAAMSRNRFGNASCKPRSWPSSFAKRKWSGFGSYILVGRLRKKAALTLADACHSDDLQEAGFSNSPLAPLRHHILAAPCTFYCKFLFLFKTNYFIIWLKNQNLHRLHPCIALNIRRYGYRIPSRCIKLHLSWKLKSHCRGFAYGPLFPLSLIRSERMHTVVNKWFSFRYNKEQTCLCDCIFPVDNLTQRLSIIMRSRPVAYRAHYRVIRVYGYIRRPRRERCRLRPHAKHDAQQELNISKQNHGAQCI